MLMRQRYGEDVAIFENRDSALSSSSDDGNEHRAKYGTDDSIAKVAKDTAASLLRSGAGSAGLSFPNKPVVPNKPAGFA